MPMGADAPVLGAIAFGCVKLAGYTGVAYIAKRTYTQSQVNVIHVGIARTVLGFAAGAAYWMLADMVFTTSGDGGANDVKFLLGLLPVRIAEWGLICWWFFDRRAKDLRTDLTLVVTGTLSSYVLDIPAILGLIVVSGFWVC